MTKQRTVTIELPVTNKWGSPDLQDFFNEVQKRFNAEVKVNRELYSFLYAKKLHNEYYEFSKLKRAIELEPSVIEDRKELKRLVWIVGFRNEEIKKLEDAIEKKDNRIEELNREVAKYEYLNSKGDYTHPVKTEYSGKLRIEN